MRREFTFADIEQECQITTGVHALDGRTFGAAIKVPPALMQQYPYNASAYELMEQLRNEIFGLGTIEWPDLPVNRQNYTLAQRSPFQHGYSQNPYTTDLCQMPHQDTPPYPTAFWLPQARRYSATWVMGLQGLKQFNEHMHRESGLDVVARHRLLVPKSLEQGTGILLNQNPGLLLIDNSDRHHLYHARTCNFTAMDAADNFKEDTPMYAFNEVGLLNYIDMLDERRGSNDRNPEEAAQVRAFLHAEKLA